jgi:uncharacterized protein (DUF427 family)
MQAIWNHTVIAESDETILIENNHYFPPAAVKKEYLKLSFKHSTCPWKGEASYFDLEVNGKVHKDAAWFYPEPKNAASEIKNYVAFSRVVKVTKEPVSDTKWSDEVSVE